MLNFSLRESGHNTLLGLLSEVVVVLWRPLDEGHSLPTSFIYHYKQSINSTVSTKRASCANSEVWNLMWGRCMLVWWGAGFGQWPIRYLLGLRIWLTSCPLAVNRGSVCSQRGLRLWNLMQSKIGKTRERSHASGMFQSSKAEHHHADDKNLHLMNLRLLRHLSQRCLRLVLVGRDGGVVFHSPWSPCSWLWVIFMITACLSASTFAWRRTYLVLINRRAKSIHHLPGDNLFFAFQSVCHAML